MSENNSLIEIDGNSSNCFSVWGSGKKFFFTTYEIEGPDRRAVKKAGDETIAKIIAKIKVSPWPTIVWRCRPYIFEQKEHYGPRWVPVFSWYCRLVTLPYIGPFEFNKPEGNPYTRIDAEGRVVQHVGR